MLARTRASAAATVASAGTEMKSGFIIPPAVCGLWPSRERTLALLGGGQEVEDRQPALLVELHQQVRRVVGSMRASTAAASSSERSRRNSTWCSSSSSSNTSASSSLS